MKRAGRFAVAVVALMTAGGAWAGTDTVELTVSATVPKACVVGTPTAMSFGSLQLLDAAAGKVVTGGAADAAGTLSVACTNGATGVSFTFVGTAASDFSLRQEAAPTNTVGYALFADPARSDGIARGLAKASSAFAGFAANGTDRQLTIYGRLALAGLATKPVGTYTDTVTVTVSYDD